MKALAIASIFIFLAACSSPINLEIAQNITHSCANEPTWAKNIETLKCVLLNSTCIPQGYETVHPAACDCTSVTSESYNRSFALALCHEQDGIDRPIYPENITSLQECIFNDIVWVSRNGIKETCRIEYEGCLPLNYDLNTTELCEIRSVPQSAPADETAAN